MSVAGIVCGLVPPTSSSSTASRRPARAGTGWCASSRDATARRRPTWGAGPWEAELDRLEALAPPALRARRLLDGRAARAGARAADPGAGAALVLVSAIAGSGRPRRARRAAGGRRGARATRIEAIGDEAFARAWAAQPLFADQPPEVAAAAHARPAAAQRGRARRPAARARHRGDAAAVGSTRRAGDAGRRSSSASATRSSARSRSAWAFLPSSCRAPGTPCTSRPRSPSRRTCGCPETLATARGRGTLAVPCFGPPAPRGVARRAHLGRRVAPAGA